MLPQETPSEKLKKSKPLTDSTFVIKLRDKLYPFLMLLTKTKVRYKVQTMNDCAYLPDKPVIFAANHSAFPDTPIMLRVTGRRSYILGGRQKLPFLDWLLVSLNGMIWVDRKNRADMAAVKIALTEYLKKGQSILWFPEGTWNLTDNLLMLPMRWGIIDIAKRCDAQILPVALDYNRADMVCRVQFGAPFVGGDFADKTEAIRNLRDRMATLRWELMSRQKVVHRGKDTKWMREEMFEAVREYPAFDHAYESGCVFVPPEYMQG